MRGERRVSDFPKRGLVAVNSTPPTPVDPPDGMPTPLFTAAHAAEPRVTPDPTTWPALTDTERREEAWQRIRAAGRYLREISPERSDTTNRTLLEAATALLQRAGEWLP